MMAGYPCPHFVLDMNLLFNVKYKSSNIKNMNKLPPEKRVQILSMLCEESSMQATNRVADVSIDTVSKLLLDAAPKLGPRGPYKKRANQENFSN